MRAELLPFDVVFDGRSNFAPRAILDLHRQDVPVVARLLEDSATEGEDGLDRFRAVPMALVDDDGRMHRFALWRHAGTPPGQVAIQMPLEDEVAATLAAILTVMEVPAAALIWSEEPAHPAPPMRRAVGARGARR